MNIEELRNHCLSVKGATESFPFDKKTLVFKVMGKMFAYINLEPKDALFRVDMKCDPDKSTELREKYTGITYGTHTRELMWNAVYLLSDVPDSLIQELINHSVSEVINKLPKKKQAEYKDLK
ncbi:MAG: MmcQ/YjbR family DNA-binding protein [Prevotella sp.]|jgi:predicted DNA-binding protein (MmcQ/YjbR family)|nr:MmcQ/YjbR family DNA-binding protein [Prevotella sp.]